MNKVRRFGSNNSSPKKASSPSSRVSLRITSAPVDTDEVSPELVPIVTLLSSQAHRRYHEGVFMLYYDLNGDGKPADRVWKEVYGILTGNQLAYWDAANLAQFRNNPDALLETSAKPNYLNFTDAAYNAMKNLPAAKQNLNNVIIVSTTLKNRYIIQFKSEEDLASWYLALRLSNYEYQSLQEAYTAALLSARGSRLSDIRTVLAEKRFNHEDWVSIRYGSGMAWKRCYAVVEPSTLKKKTFTPGRILFFENDQQKKKSLMAVVTNATSVTAIYPQSPLLIDHSTMLKLDCAINFKSPSLKASKKPSEDVSTTSVFLMPEQHSAVPGFDTLIRFMIPLLDSFGLYGRPKRLKADRLDAESLLFGLPTLPHVHYLNIDDIDQLKTRPDWLAWSASQWNSNFKNIMKLKLDRGYEGCGSARGFSGAVSSLSSPRIGSPLSSTFRNPSSGVTPSQDPKVGSTLPKSNPLPPSSIPKLDKNVNNLSLSQDKVDPHKLIQLAEIYNKYSDIDSPSDQFHVNRNQLLNGEAEELDEDVLPSSVRKLTLSDNHPAYPTNDNELFSDDSDDEIEQPRLTVPGLPTSGSSSSSIGAGAGGLAVPSYNDRNVSYSSVQSPMTQYNEFNQQFNRNVQPPAPLNLSDDEYVSESEPELPPPVPPHHSPQKASHITKSQPSLNLNETTQPNRPRHITSPNRSQNQSPRRINLAESAALAPGPLQTAIAPGPQQSTLAPTSGFQQPAQKTPTQQQFGGPIGQPRTPNQQQFASSLLLPQQSLYPQSLQYGYAQPQPKPQQPQQYQQPQQGQPHPQAQYAPKPQQHAYRSHAGHPGQGHLGQGHASQAPSLAYPQLRPGPQAQSAPRHAPQGHHPQHAQQYPQQYPPQGQHAYRQNLPPSISVQSVPNQQARPLYNGGMPRPQPQSSSNMRSYGDDRQDAYHYQAQAPSSSQQPRPNGQSQNQHGYYRQY